MRLLFTDTSYHQITKSADFFLDILREGFEVEPHYYHDVYDIDIPKESIKQADGVVVFQTILDRRRFSINGKPCVYVPMYDADWGSKFLWRRIALSGMSVISFSNEIEKLARRGGVSPARILNVRYAFSPEPFRGWEGDPRVAALWDRGQVGIAEIKKLFPPGMFKKIVIFRRNVGGARFKPIDDKDIVDYNIVVHESGFLPKDEYLQLLKEPGVYIAPRWQEGIGMSFLEQLAMGKCVIANDDGTMNEYLKDGESGILRKFRGSCSPVSMSEIEKVRRNVRDRAVSLYAQWVEDRRRIIPFVRNAIKRDSPVRLGGVYDGILYLGYLLEAAVRRVDIRS